MNLLIVNVNVVPDYLKRKLESKFPEISILAAETEDEVGDFIEKTEILIAGRISDELLRRAKKLQWIQCQLTGVDYILNQPSLRKDVLLTSARGIHGPQVSELTFLLMLALGRRFPQVIQNQGKKVWDRWPGKLLWKKKVGILGVGVIGEEIARKCKAFGMTVFGIDAIKREIDAVDCFFGPGDLLQVLKEVDYFVNVVPNTPETQNMIGARELSAMKPSAFFINVGRGETVDEEALIKVLRERKIAGAGLDVYLKEPLPEDSPFWELDNVIVSPHVGGLSDVYADQVLPIFEENLRRFLKGERRDLINFIAR